MGTKEGKQTYLSTLRSPKGLFVVNNNKEIISSCLSIRYIRMIASLYKD